MPDLVRLRFIGPHPVSVPALGRDVEPDCIADFPGSVLEDAADHYLIESGNPPEPRAWPKSMWANETPASKKPKE